MSMTGYATRRGAAAAQDWQWEIRSVNGKGLDLRLRLPDLEGLDAAVRAAVAGVAVRGSVSVSLRLGRSAAGEGVRISPDGLEAALRALATVERMAQARGLDLAPARAADLLSLRGVIETAPQEDAEDAPLRAAVLADLAPLLADFAAMRGAEGAHIAAVLAEQVDRIAALTGAAAEAAEARRPEAATALQAALARVLDGAPGADPHRVAQELALIAVKSDVTEEIDRLRAHVAAARGLLAAGGPIGRKLDFLVQEFLREANTLCSKSGSVALTAIGLDLKHAIDQMREQIQNLE